ncbi:MAG: hypothetical protein NUV80_00465 [Candidatus Berkelbacteria bacterium]|nr:hypothetical protein [Candidatus Berkelbacteria bacterium]MCR4307019.1 hypothetical protein [Candidatus Berkelbacteria bacterium]
MEQSAVEEMAIDIPVLDLSHLMPKTGLEDEHEKLSTRPKGGAPTVITPYVLIRLQEAFLWGCSDVEACTYAHISDRTLYRYQVKYPKFCQEKEAFKTAPILKARQTIVDNLGNPKVAMWYLERKRRDEFDLKATCEVSISRGQEIVESLKKELRIDDESLAKLAKKEFD